MLAIDFGAEGVVVIKGRLDAAEAPAAQTFLDATKGTVTLDCSGLEYISSAGLGVLLKTQKRLMCLRRQAASSPASTTICRTSSGTPVSTRSSKSRPRGSRPRQLFRPPRVIVDNETDQALLERYRNGDREAFSDLVVRYQRPIYNAAFWLTRRAEDASDITQTVFLRVAERLDEYDPKYKFFSWIYRIAVNESLNLLRSNRREEALDDAIDIPDGDGANPEWQVGEAQVSRRIQNALMGMTQTTGRCSR